MSVVWGSFTSHVCSSIQLSFNTASVVQAEADDGMRNNGEQAPWRNCSPCLATNERITIYNMAAKHDDQ